MVRLLPFVFRIAVLGSVLASPLRAEHAFQLTSDEAEFVRSLPPLRVMVDEEFRPLSRWSADDARYVGISPDLFRQAAQALGLRYEFVREPKVPFSERVARIERGEIDLLMSVSITDDRLKKGLFTVGYLSTYYAAIGRKGQVLGHDSRLAAVSGTAVVANLKSLVDEGNLLLFPGAKDPYDAVREGRADFAIQNLLVFEEDRFALELFDWEVSRVFTEWPRTYGFFFSRTAERPKLIALFNRFLAQADISPLQSRYVNGAEVLVLKYVEQKHWQEFLVWGLVASFALLFFLGLAVRNLRKFRASEARFRSLSEASMAAIAIHDFGRILDCNQRLLEMTGYTREELIGSDGLALIAPDSRARVQQAIASGQTQAYEVEGVKKDGTHFPVGVRGTNIPYQGRPVRVTEFFDLSDLRAAEAAIERAKKQYDRLVAHLPVGVYVLRTRPDGSLTFDYVSPPMAEMVGASVSRILADPWSASESAHPEDKVELDRLNAERIPARLPFEWCGRFLFGERVRWLRIVSRPEPQEDGDVLWHGLITDVTETKEAEAKVQALLAEKELLLREVHHRIKNNMATVTGLLTLQAANLAEPRAVAALDEARARVISMMVLYDKLYQQGDITGRLSLADYLPALVEEVLTSFPPRAGVTWDCQTDDLVLEVKTLSSLAILVNELLTNVMKYAFTGRTSGLVRVSAVRVENRCRLEVEDNGCGLPRGFDPAHSTGFGLGLVHLLAQSLRATLTFESQPGHGTLVRLEFIAE